MAESNVVVTGVTVGEQGSSFVMHGQETVVASLGFSDGFDAPKGGVDKSGEYLSDFKPSPTPTELVQNAGSQSSKTATIRYDHIMDGNINGRGQGSGGALYSV